MQKEITLKSTISFIGLTFNNRYSLKEEDLITSKEKGALLVLEETHNNTYRKKGVFHKFSPIIDEERLITATNDMAPYFPFQENGVDAEMIRKDLPELSEEQLEENIDIINDYYTISFNNAIANRYHNSSFIPVPIDDDGVPENPNPPKLPNFINIAKGPNESTIDCFMRSNSLNLAGLSVFISAGAESNRKAKEYYGHLNTVNTKRDAFRHTLWNALMCRRYFTISSKVNKRNMAEHASEINERCGENGYATRQMDYHNNQIGRKIWDDNTTYKRTLG